MKIRTPSNVEVLLHYHVAGFDLHPRHMAPAVRDATALFLKRGLIVYSPGVVIGYETTPKGCEAIKKLCGVEI